MLEPDAATSIVHSRPLRLAAAASRLNDSALHRRLSESRVHLSIDPNDPGAVATLHILATTLRRLPVNLSLDPTGMDLAAIATIEANVRAIDPERNLALSADPGRPTVHVHVGMTPRPGAIRAIAHRHGGHLLSESAVAGPTVSDASGLGAMFTASCAAAEAFKTLAAVRPDRMRTVSRMSFCPVTLQRDPQLGPVVQAPRFERLALIGLGSVGTAITRILELLGAAGDVLLVDDQAFAAENLGTYSLGTLYDTIIKPAKTALAAAALSNFDVTRFDHPVAQLIAEIDKGAVPWPSLVITALDSITARHDAQRLWPDRVIDVGTGDTSVGLHDLRPDGPCAMCVLRPARTDPLAELASATGLDIRYLSVDDILDAETVAKLPPDKQALLSKHVGGPRCGLANALGLTNVAASDYQPAVPFVAQQAACLAVGRLLAAHVGLASDIAQVQYDVLRGTDQALFDTLTPRRDCYCQHRSELVRRVRATRAGAQMKPV